MDRVIFRKALLRGTLIGLLVVVVYYLLSLGLKGLVVNDPSHSYGVALGLFIGNAFFHTWIRYDFLKKTQEAKKRHELILSCLKQGRVL